MAPRDKRQDETPFLSGGRALERRRQFLEQRGLPGADEAPDATVIDPPADDDRGRTDGRETKQKRPSAEPRRRRKESER